MGIAETLSRLINAILNLINRKKADEAQKDPVDFIAGNDDKSSKLHESNQSFADISKKSESDKT
jgi:hypothetical protein